MKSGQYESNPDFPDREDHGFNDCIIKTVLMNCCYQDLAVYWCWQTTTETDKTGHTNEIGVATATRIDGSTAKSLS